MKLAGVSHESLKEAVHYDPDTGLFTRLGLRRGGVGESMGRISGNGYLAAMIFGDLVYLHRAALFYMTGSWPMQVVDHINGNRTDNRWSNLRESTWSQNSANAKLSSANTSGYKGVRLHRKTGEWQAYVGHKYLGRYKNILDADAACRRFRVEKYGEFANHGERS